MPTLAVDGTSLEYTDRGEGPAVVFLHGGLSDLRVWSRQTEVLSRSYRTVAFSFRHYFPNEPPRDTAAISYDILVSDTATLLRELGLAPAHLVGQSTGAFVALILAREQPDLVDSLVLAEPPALPLLGLEVPPKPSQIARLFLRAPASAIAVVRFGVKGLGPAMRAFRRGEDERGLRAFVTAVLGRETVEAWPADRWQKARDNVPAFKAVLGGSMPPFGESDARGITIPSLLVTGEGSAPVLHRITDRLEVLLPDVSRVDIPGASHLMFEDDPDGFNQAVLSFLDSRNG